MKIVTLNGGLGNQVFQYIFARYVEEISGEKCLLENSYFFNNPDHNGYELEKIWGIKADLLSNCFTKDVWNEMTNKVRDGESIVQQLYDNGINIAMVREAEDCKFDGNTIVIPMNQYIPQIALSTGDIYYHGYWINKYWFTNNKNKIMKELEFPPILDIKNKEYEKMIMESKSVAVHIRRGDFVKLGWELSNKFYYDSMNNMSQIYPNAKYFIFSDDINWCKKNYEELGFQFADENIVFVEGNFDKTNNYVDLQLMALCKGMIMSNSSFCYLAALLNRNEGIPIINPTSREV